jgi:hypothetical protein
MHELKGLSLEIPIGKVNTLNRVENKTNVFDMREYIGFPGVSDLGMLHIVMIRQLGRPCQFFTQRE